MLGRTLFPHPQWDHLAALWESFYPPLGLRPQTAILLRDQEAHIPELVELLINHQPDSLGGRALIEVLDLERRQPAKLRADYERWERDSSDRYRCAPTLVFAALGQQRADGAISAEDEAETLTSMLVHWALKNTLVQSADAAKPVLLSKFPKYFNA